MSATTFSALVILAEIGDVNRFLDEKKIFSYAGLVPSVHKSGDKVYCGHSKITEFYRKLKRKGKHENVAIIGAS